MWETWVQSLGREDPLEKGTAIHSRVLAWNIPWTEELGGTSPWGRKELDTSEQLTVSASPSPSFHLMHPLSATSHGRLCHLAPLLARQTESRPAETSGAMRLQEMPCGEEFSFRKNRKFILVLKVHTATVENLTSIEQYKEDIKATCNSTAHEAPADT